MPRNRNEMVACKTAKKTQSTVVGSQDVSADQVIETLLGLFRELGIDTAKSTVQPQRVRKTKTESNTLYPYTLSIGELLTRWHQDPLYLDDKGNPAIIKLNGKSPSFRNLARQTVPNIDDSFLLSELERLGAVTVHESKSISVHMRSFPVYEDKRLAIQHTLTTLNGFIKTLRHNLDSNPANSNQLFHRIAWNNNFDSRELQALKIRVKRHGQGFLESFDDWLTRKSLSKKHKSYGRKKAAKVSVGIYLSVEKA